jgi:hypothetical protein
MATGSFPGVKCGRGVLLTTHPLLVPQSWKSRAIPLPTLWATSGPVKGTLYFYINLLRNSGNRQPRREKKYVKLKVKVKVALEQDTKAQRGIRGIVLLFL